MMLISKFGQLGRLVAHYYNEPHRKYHTVNHINRMFTDAESLNIPLLKSQELAILFHDIIYVPGSKTNEFDSGQMLVWFWNTYPNLFKYYTKHDITEAEKIINDTATHSTNRSYSKVILDLDLYGLADDYDDYLEAGHRVRQEFNMYSDEQWSAGRIKFLSGFINRDSIFHTKQFSDFEAKAKSNLVREYNELCDNLCKN